MSRLLDTGSGSREEFLYLVGRQVRDEQHVRSSPFIHNYLDGGLPVGADQPVEIDGFFLVGNGPADGIGTRVTGNSIDLLSVLFSIQACQLGVIRSPLAIGMNGHKMPLFLGEKPWELFHVEGGCHFRLRGGVCQRNHLDPLLLMEPEK